MEETSAPARSPKGHRPAVQTNGDLVGLSCMCTCLYMHARVCVIDTHVAIARAAVSVCMCGRYCCAVPFGSDGTVSIRGRELCAVQKLCPHSNTEGCVFQSVVPVRLLDHTVEAREGHAYHHALSASEYSKGWCTPVAVACSDA